MTTPIYDFAKQYSCSAAVRMHMPGHKGVPRLGCEPLDLTEIAGADELFAPDGIIAESEENASRLFGCKTVYSTEGASLCIRAMLYLAMQHAVSQGRKPVIAAARNVHKSFLTAAALLDFEMVWLPHASGEGYLSGGFSADALSACMPHQPTALYLTSPDYAGGFADLRAAADFCHAHDMLLLVDCAHGAYLKFLPKSLFPTDLGADLCCASAHKTLPVLTGGAYLCIADAVPEICKLRVKTAMTLFASTSPSYLILESLDLCNAYLEHEYPARLRDFLPVLHDIRQTLTDHGWTLCGDEPMKLTLRPKSFGYTGYTLAEILRQSRIYAEFADPDLLVLMPAPDSGSDALRRMTAVLCGIPRRTPILDAPPPLPVPQSAVSPRTAILSETEVLPVSQCTGRISAELALSCPPAVPIVMCGERIDADAVRCMQYYEITHCTVLLSS